MKRASWLLAAITLISSGAAFAAGAIAVDDEEGETDPGYGFVTGYDTRAAAAKGAMKECRESGNENCKVVARFDTCGAYAASRKFYGVGWGTSQKAAERMALENCGRNCEVVISECE
jgi:hypothetical protein